MLEVFSSIVSAVCVIAVLIIVIGISFVIVITLKRSTDSDKILQGDRRRRTFVGDLIRSNFFKVQLMHGITVPYNPQVQSDGLVNIENLIVTRGGIMVVSTLRVSGFIDNPAHNDWIQYADGHITPMRNPVELNEANVRAVRNLLRAENLNNIRVHNILVYPYPDTQFRYRCDSVVSADALLPYIRDLSKLKFIPMLEVKNVADRLRKYRVRRGAQNRQIPPQNMQGRY